MRPEVEARVDAALDRLGPLPVLGGTVAQVRALAEDPYSLTDDLVAVIERDEAFALNLLRYANQAAVRPIRARSVRQAVTLVGRRALTRLALEAATYRFLERVPGAGHASRGQMHVHAMAVAACSASAAERTGTPVDVVHLAGLLHDVGKLILPLAFPVERVEAVALAFPGGARRALAERDELGVDHAWAGALLSRRSEVGEDVCDAIALHHGGRSSQESPTREAACVQIGNAIVGMLGGLEPDGELVHLALRRLELEPSALDDLAEESALVPPTRPGARDLAERIGRLERLAQTDELTDVANRRHWLALVTEELQADRPGSVLICDVDRFKEVNDRHGHRAGDLLLAELARVLDRHGLPGRLGGDEFGVWVPGDLAAGRAAAQALLEEAARSLPGEGVSVSVGVAEAGAHGHDLTALLEAADRALYRAKAGGRARVEEG